MEQHGNSTQNNVIAILPARYESVRLPGKLLLDLGGEPVILHTLTQVAKAKNIDRVIVATDSDRIRDVVEASGFESIRTSNKHRSGTDRIAEACERLLDFDLIVNVQSDEPFIDPETIDQTVSILKENAGAQMSTAYEVIKEPSKIKDPNCVKVVVSESGQCLYFSRSPIPYPRDAVIKDGSLDAALLKGKSNGLYKKHIGIYAYRREFLLKFAGTAQTALEKTESLEQLRALEIGTKIYACEVSAGGIGIDTIEDLEEARHLLKVSSRG